MIEVYYFKLEEFTNPNSWMDLTSSNFKKSNNGNNYIKANNCLTRKSQSYEKKNSS